ncbi:MAG TPA: hypothetical protein PKI19_09455, partial [Elusimicrobiales bacterium]|nr:hypothetical protein [Elusimicrobiales bacterium]
MFKKTAAAFAIITAVSTLVSAAINFDTPNINTLQQEISALELNIPAVPAPEKAYGKADKEWTIMVFINGKNNLMPYALKDMNEMEKIGSTDKIHVVTET